jgi:hypothetical protein
VKLLEIASNSGSLGRGKPVRSTNAARESLRHGLGSHGVTFPIRPVSPTSELHQEVA